MANSFSMEPIAHIRSDFAEKFGVPRQSGLVDALEAAVVFEEPYRNPDALRGLEGFSHIWLIWAFHQSQRPEWSPTVRPPRLGGNQRVGVFASRSPFRPNPIGLSSLMGTATRRPPAALPASRRVPRWRWKSHPPCWTNCLRTGGRPCGMCWPWIPVPGISRTRTGCTASSSPGRR